MFYVQSRQFIEKLINLQRGMSRKGFIRHDYNDVIKSICELEKYLKIYRYDNDDKMRNFWKRKENYIITLLPGQNYPGYEKLMEQFLSLKNEVLCN